MKSVQKGLRDGDIEKDVYGRLVCTECDVNLQTENDPDELGSVRRCPDCGAEFKELRT
ncbi:MAG: HVO_0758 family zinc finger protein [Halobacteriales archaeon]